MAEVALLSNISQPHQSPVPSLSRLDRAALARQRPETPIQDRAEQVRLAHLSVQLAAVVVAVEVQDRAEQWTSLGVLEVVKLHSPQLFLYPEVLQFLGRPERADLETPEAITEKIMEVGRLAVLALHPAWAVLVLRELLLLRSFTDEGSCFPQRGCLLL